MATNKRLVVIYFMFTFFSCIYIIPTISQCAFEIDEYDKIDKLLIVETKKDRIYYKFVGQEAIKFSFGSHGTDDYYIAFEVLLTTDAWFIEKRNEIQFKLDNGNLLTLNPINFIESEEYYEPLGAYYRQIGTFKCQISLQDIEELQGQKINRLHIPALEIANYKVKRKNQETHKTLINCLVNRVKELKSKYPNLTKKDTPIIVNNSRNNKIGENESSTASNTEVLQDKTLSDTEIKENHQIEDLYITEECEIKLGPPLIDYVITHATYDTIYKKVLFKEAGYEDAVYDTIKSQHLNAGASSRIEYQKKPKYIADQKLIRFPNGKGEMLLTYQKLISEGQIRVVDVPARFQSFTSLIAINKGSKGNYHEDQYDTLMVLNLKKNSFYKEDTLAQQMKIIECPIEKLSDVNYNKYTFTIRIGSKMYETKELNNFESVQEEQSCFILNAEIYNDQYLHIKTEQDEEGYVSISNIKELMNIKNRDIIMYDD